ncbi:MAG: GxxExxY protein [Planctomycetota bacterium]|jgi:GxxExxY protein
MKPRGTDSVTEKIIGGAIRVHRALGPGLLESTYEACLAYELSKAGLSFRSQVPMPVVYGEVKLDCGYRLDLLVEEAVIVEMKSVEKLLPIHEAQLLLYLKIAGLRCGLLLNFNVKMMKSGIRRILNGYA